MISAQQLKVAIISGTNHILNQKQAVDELNVFPVPDGDTGTNMSMTMSAAKQVLENCDSDRVDEVAKQAASALLRGARGNSGVILSLLFRGFSKGLKGQETVTAEGMAEALSIGVKQAYKAVMNPTEGTILTVARLAAEKASNTAQLINDPVVVFADAVAEAKVALANTPELLPVLKKAGVVDAGGQGLVVIFEGMLSVFQSDTCIALQQKQQTPQPVDGDNHVFVDFDGEITFFYCTEFLVNKSDESDDPLKLRAYLETIGDSVVVVDDEDIIKVHVHTNHPGDALEHALQFGSLMKIKIENMVEQFAQKQDEAIKTKQQFDYVKPDPEVPYGFVSIAAGAGVSALFADLGVSHVVSGGQTMNPSTDDILAAVHATGAETVFVLPNNKNIIMAAEQVVKLADRRVCVLQTTSIPQGISALLAFDGMASFEDNRVNMTHAFGAVGTGQITFAARDSDFDGHAIKQGEILALEEGKLSFVEKDVPKALYKLVRGMTRKKSGGFLTVLYGSNITDEQADDAQQLLQHKLGNRFEITFINGGQPVYYYIVSVE